MEIPEYEPVALVGVNGRDEVTIRPILYHPLSKIQALDLAVRLVAVADDGTEKLFGKMLRKFLES